MDYCAPRGILYADFLEWDPLSRDAALAWQARENARCGGCGQVKADWMTVDDEGREVFDDGHPPFLVEEHWCPACDALARARRGQGDERPDGMHLGFRRNEEAVPPVDDE